ncbi:hypothetical protein IMZ48_07415 [Candidatus Bathyarchaeota archaeon]|nr:hypothetical protein [Candidatus Bathyarchaeota archaeon]
MLLTEIDADGTVVNFVRHVWRCDFPVVVGGNERARMEWVLGKGLVVGGLQARGRKNFRIDFDFEYFSFGGACGAPEELPPSLETLDLSGGGDCGLAIQARGKGLDAVSDIPTGQVDIPTGVLDYY